VVAAAANGPAVLHIAAHFVPHPAFADEVLIALGVRRSGDAEYLGPSDIAFQRMRVGLVTLSGCSSGSGASLPGLGIFGLTRAWLTAGANAVVASHWPIADDTGGLLAAMYERLGQSQEPLSASRVAEALHSAQLRMIASGGWRSKPVYWSAFEVIGKE
jgi:CHAT domain-containing protein